MQQLIPQAALLSSFPMTLETTFPIATSILVHHDSDPSTMWISLKVSIIINACNLFIPKKSFTHNPSPPWFNCTIHHQLNKLHSLGRSQQKRPTQTKLSKINSMEIDLIKSAREFYEKTLVSDFLTTQKNSTNTFIFLIMTSFPLTIS